jgi:hypothetical protein
MEAAGGEKRFWNPGAALSPPFLTRGERVLAVSSSSLIRSGAEDAANATRSVVTAFPTA